MKPGLSDWRAARVERLAAALAELEPRPKPELHPDIFNQVMREMMR